MLKVHLGCGDNIFHGWTNVDIEGPAQIKADLSQNVPFNDNSVDFVYSEHFIEHIPRDRGLWFLQQCKRILKPDGIIRIATPDLKIYCQEYMAKRLDRWRTHWQPGTPCQMVNEGMRRWGHQFIYDDAEMFMIFREAGFSNTVKCEYRQSSHQDLKNLETRPNWEDLYFEACKKF